MSTRHRTTALVTEVGVYELAGDVRFEICSVEHMPHGVTLQLAGELDVASHTMLNVAVKRVLDSPRRIVHLDMSRVSFCDCAGLSAILQASARVEAHGGRLTAHAFGRQVRRLFSAARLDDHLHRLEQTVDLPD